MSDPIDDFRNAVVCLVNSPMQEPALRVFQELNAAATKVLRLTEERDALRKEIASLKARRVKMPYITNEYGPEVMTWNRAVRSCESAIRAAGVEVEP